MEILPFKIQRPPGDTKSPFYYFLTPEEQVEYEYLHVALCTPMKCKIEQKLSYFKKHLRQVKEFCNRTEKNRDLRSAACGVCWTEKVLAINIRVLGQYIGKSKAVINMNLNKIGYISFSSRNSDIDIITHAMPFLQYWTHEIRKWKIRRKVEPISRIIINPRSAIDEMYEQLKDSQEGENVFSYEIPSQLESYFSL